MEINGKLIKQLREARDWSQSDLAAKLGTTRETISNYERGKKIPESRQEILKRVFANIKLEDTSSWNLKEDTKPYERIKKLDKFSNLEIILYIENNEDSFLKTPEFLSMITRLSTKNETIKKLIGEVDVLRAKMKEILKS